MMSESKGFIIYSLAPAVSASVMCCRSFSVVQKMTTGFSPPGMLRSLIRNSSPFMLGMFQSSKTASGMAFVTASTARRPSSASSHNMCRSSTILRATLRITRLSSTTRHVFVISGLLRFFGKVQQLGYIQHDQETSGKPEHACRYLAPARVKRGRRRFVIGHGARGHLAHLVNL